MSVTTGCVAGLDKGTIVMSYNDDGVTVAVKK